MDITIAAAKKVRGEKFLRDSREAGVHPIYVNGIRVGTSFYTSAKQTREAELRAGETRWDLNPGVRETVLQLQDQYTRSEYPDSFVMDPAHNDFAPPFRGGYPQYTPLMYAGAALGAKQAYNRFRGKPFEQTKEGKKLSKVIGGDGKRISEKRKRYSQLDCNMQELKFLDGFQNTRSLDPTMTTFTLLEKTLNEVAQGSGSEERLGRTIRMKSIQVRFTLSTQAASVRDVPMRVMICLDRQNNQDANGMAKDAAGVDGTEMFPTAASWQSYQNLSNGSRFVILESKSLFAKVTELAALTMDFANFYVKCDIPIDYVKGAAGDITAITRNNIFLCILTPFYDVDIRVSYTYRIRYTG